MLDNNKYFIYKLTWLQWVEHKRVKFTR